MNKGDYVLATKYGDGDPFDGYAVGFFDAMLPKVSEDRFMVVNGEGQQYRGNGFRRCERITEELGSWIVRHRIAIEALSSVDPVNIWRFKYGGERERQALERWADDEGAEVVRSYFARNVQPFGRAREDEIARYQPQQS